LAHPDLEFLLAEVLKPAMPIYAESGVLEPVAMTLDCKGQTQTVFTDFQGALASDTDQINLLIEHLRPLAAAGRIVASAICFVGRVDLPAQNAVKVLIVNLERFDGERVSVFFPVLECAGEIKYGEIGACDLCPQVFVSH
jgi:hypothetical protein